MTLPLGVCRSPSPLAWRGRPGGPVSGPHSRAVVTAVVWPWVSKRPEGAPLWTVWGSHCQQLVRATCFGGAWVVGDRWRWFPVTLPEAACPRGRGVRIAQMWCRIRTSRMRRATLWRHGQCSRSRSSRV